MEIKVKEGVIYEIRTQEILVKEYFRYNFLNNAKHLESIRMHLYVDHVK